MLSNLICQLTIKKDKTAQTDSGIQFPYYFFNLCLSKKQSNQSPYQKNRTGACNRPSPLPRHRLMPRAHQFRPGAHILQFHKLRHTLCPRSSYPIYIVTYHIKLVATSLTHSRIRICCCERSDPLFYFTRSFLNYIVMEFKNNKGKIPISNILYVNFRY